MVWSSTDVKDPSVLTTGIKYEVNISAPRAAMPHTHMHSDKVNCSLRLEGSHRLFSSFDTPENHWRTFNVPDLPERVQEHEENSSWRSSKKKKTLSTQFRSEFNCRKEILRQKLIHRRVQGQI